MRPMKTESEEQRPVSQMEGEKAKETRDVQAVTAEIDREGHEFHSCRQQSDGMSGFEPLRNALRSEPQWLKPRSVAT